MRRLLPAVAAAAILMSYSAWAQTTAPGDIAPNPASPGATPSTTPSSPAAKPTEPTGERLAPKDSAITPTMTEEEAKKWVDKAVYSSDNKNVGEVAAILRDASGKVTELHADIGGFLGIGTTRVRLMPSQFQLSGDKVQLNVGSETVKSFPKIEK